eukprot:1153558-Pelagomonas_calceolata.AAC.8
MLLLDTGCTEGLLDLPSWPHIKKQGPHWQGHASVQVINLPRQQQMGQPTTSANKVPAHEGFHKSVVRRQGWQLRKLITCLRPASILMFLLTGMSQVKGHDSDLCAPLICHPGIC